MSTGTIFEYVMLIQQNIDNLFRNMHDNYLTLHARKLISAGPCIDQ
jgi:hypothetical protein